MKKILLPLLVLAVVKSANGGWWPFDSDDDDYPRLSEIMEPASTCIDEASDLASEGKVSEAVEKYREALKELDLIEDTYPEKLDQPEFATIKTKRAFVSAAIDSMLLGQARANAKVVSTSDTTELEKRLAKEKAKGKAKVEVKEESKVKEGVKVESKSKVEVKVDTSPRGRAMRALAAKDFAAAEVAIGEMLKENPKGATALNLRAAMEAAQGRYKEAERTLDEAIESNPRDYFAYYNMSALFLQTRTNDTSVARRYYETGRVYGGPQDAELEAAFKR